MILRDLSRTELRGRCAESGLTWEVGPFAVRLRTNVSAATDGVGFLYADFPILDGDTVVDAELVVRRKRTWPLATSIHVDGELQYDWLKQSLVVPLLEWAMNVSVFQRSHQYFMLHSAVVSRGGKSAILAGRAGSGKSTLCAALVQRGWRLLSDEVALICPKDGQLQPVPRPISLKDRSIDAIRGFAPDAPIGPSWPGTAKGTVAHVLPPRDSVLRTDEPSTPAWLLFPSYQAETDIVIEPLAKGRAFMAAADNAFNYSVLGRRGFEILADLIDRCDCFELRYGNLEASVRRFEELVS